MLNDFGVVTVDCAGAAVTLSPPSASVSGEGATLQVSVTGTRGCGWRAATADPWLNTLSTGVSDGTVYVTVAANRSLASRTGTVTVGNQTFTIVQSPAGITALNARSTSPTAISLTWGFSMSPDHYEVWRNDGSGFALVGSPQSSSFTDSGAPPRSALVYRVRAVMGDSTASSFTADYTHTFTLTDPSLAGLPIRAVHLEELRTIVDALRAAAGLGAAAYTDPALTGRVAKVVHIAELRAAINEMRSALGMAPVTFSSVSQGSPIRAATTQELRVALQ